MTLLTATEEFMPDNLILTGCVAWLNDCLLEYSVFIGLICPETSVSLIYKEMVLQDFWGLLHDIF